MSNQQIELIAKYIESRKMFISDGIMECLEENCNNKDHFSTIVLPIEEIDNMPCYVSIKKSCKSNKIYLVIESGFIGDRINNNFVSYYDVIIYDNMLIPALHMDYINMVNKVFEDLSHIKFYKSHGIFMKNPPEYEPMEELRSLFTHPNIKLVPDDIYCCVCLEHCNSKTHCNHLLCYVCWGKIHKTMECEYCLIDNDNDGCFGENYNNIEGIEEIRENCNKRRCPYCRKNI